MSQPAPAPLPRVFVLHLEDDPRDALLIQRELDALGVDCAFDRVETEAEFREAIARGSLDLILADHSLPSFDALSALAIARELCPDVPFICVSGSLGEELAIEALKNGATDYVLKQRLSRLAPAARRALQESAERDKRRRAEEEVRDLEAQLRHSQKLEAIGQLAGGIAHDFNNLLTVINGYCERLITTLGDGASARHDLDVIHKAGRRAAALTSQLLAFSRRQVLQPRVIEINSIVRDIEKLLRRVIGEQVLMVTVLDPSLDATRADPGQVEQVLMNLAINARDAMPDGGTLTIETSNVSIRGRADSRDALPAGRYVRLTVRDTGHGMDGETLSHIFEPFFTTKEVGKGTGLGLPTVYGIVMQSGGHITVDSTPGEGTTVHVFLPRVDPVLAAAAAASAETVTAGHETLLLVEDEELVRQLVREFLESAGYSVIEAADAEQALRIVEREAPALDMLVTDIVLPGMNGVQLADRLTTIMPGLKHLFVSGYPGTTAVRQASFDPGTAFLAKPFSRQVLTEKVREILDGDRTGPGTILVLDDDPDIRQLVMSILTGAGYGVVERVEGVAQESPERVRVDAILLDQPPGQSTRLEVVRTLRRAYPGAPILLMAGAFDADVMTRARELGVEMTLQKPVDGQSVLEAVAVAMRKVKT